MIWLLIAIAGVLLGLTVRAAAVLFCTVAVAIGTLIAFLLGATWLPKITDIVIALIVLQLFYLVGLLIAGALRSARHNSR